MPTRFPRTTSPDSDEFFTQLPDSADNKPAILDFSMVTFLLIPFLVAFRYRDLAYIARPGKTELAIKDIIYRTLQSS
jgi:hypothetical protein